MTKGFNFRFQQLLDIALFEEEGIKNRLAAQNAKVSELDSKIQKFIDDRNNALKQQELDMAAGDFVKVQMYPPYLAVLDKSQKFYETERNLQIRHRDKIMDELIEKQRQRKTYEILKEKDLSAFKKDVLKQEQKMLDEFGKRKSFSTEE